MDHVLSCLKLATAAVSDIGIMFDSVVGTANWKVSLDNRKSADSKLVDQLAEINDNC